MTTTEHCPECGSGAYVDGVCSVCRYMRNRRPLAARKRRTPCRSHTWGKAVATQTPGIVRQRCTRCPEERQVEVEGAR